MANTNSKQFKNLIVTYEANKGINNDDMVEAFRIAEPKIKVSTLLVYRSNIENYVVYGVFGKSMDTYFKEELIKYYGEDDEDVVISPIEKVTNERNEWKLEAERLQAQLDLIYNTF